MKEIVIYGRPASKKNSKQVFYKNGKYVVIPSRAYKAFEKDAGYQLLNYKKARLTGKLKIDYEFYQKGKLRQDFDNAIASINDVLQEYGVILNDKDILGGSYLVIPNARDWKTIIRIGEII